MDENTIRAIRSSVESAQSSLGTVALDLSIWEGRTVWKGRAVWVGSVPLGSRRAAGKTALIGLDSALAALTDQRAALAAALDAAADNDQDGAT